MNPSTNNSPPEITLTPRHAMPPGEAGGIFLLSINKQKICDYVGWGFASCSVALLQNFKAYPRDYTIANCPTNWDTLEKYHVELFKWLRNHGCDSWRPQEFLLLLSPSQVTNLPNMLAHPFVKEVDHFINKSHGGNRISVFRISLQKDFK